MRTIHSLLAGQMGCRRAGLLLAVVACSLGFTNSVNGQVNPNGLYQRAVGGISIMSGGLIENADVDVLGKLSEERLHLLNKAPMQLNAPAALRKISLRGLETSIEETLKAGKFLTEEQNFLGGLQDIRYVFVYPEQKDIVLVGFGEGWKVDARGNVVGMTTGRPVLLLDDLLTAIRTANSSARTGISCSIDPTPEGLQQLQAHVATLKTIGNKEATAAGIEKALGRQQVTFTGVPATSHFASVLVAADYRMKRLAMNFDRSPVRGMTSFMQMIPGTGRGMSNLMQRWWLEPTYESVVRSPDGMAWEFTGAGVKCMTEEDYAAAGGQREHQGKGSPLAQKWADSMTKHYEELAVAEPVFGELRNCMQLAMVGALIAHERMADKANCELPALTQEASLKTMELAAPTQVDSRASMLRKGSNWVISASGGVQILPGETLAKARESSAPNEARKKAHSTDASHWFWN